jgi:hypothetical protein
MSVVLASGPELSGLAAIAVLLAGALGVTVVLGALGVALIYALDRLFR